MFWSGDHVTAKVNSVHWTNDPRKSTDRDCRYMIADSHDIWLKLVCTTVESLVCPLVWTVGYRLTCCNMLSLKKKLSKVSSLNNYKVHKILLSFLTLGIHKTNINEVPYIFNEGVSKSVKYNLRTSKATSFAYLEYLHN